MTSNNTSTRKIAYRWLFLIYLQLTFRMARSQAEISLKCGQLTVQGYNSCEIEHNNDVFNYTGRAKEVLSGPFFGLITYKCDRTAGYFLSHVECEKCNFECSEEDQTASSCPTDSAQFWMGVIFGGVLSGLIVGFVYKRFPQILDANSWFNRSDNAPEKDSIATIHAEDQVIFNREEADSNSKSDGQGSVGCTSDEEGGRRNEKFKATKKALASMVAGLLLFKTGEACDVVIIMASSNNVTMLCQGSCVTQVSSFTVQQGQQICVEDHFGERVSLQISDIIWRFRYELAYYTADYDVKVTTTSDCCDQYTTCKNRDTPCSLKTIFALKKATSYNISEFKNTCYYSGFGSGYVSASSLIKIEKKGEVYSVLQLKQDGGIADTIRFTVTGRNHSQVITLRELDRTNMFDLTQYKLRNIDKIPVTVISGATTGFDTFSNAVLQYQHKFYYIDSSRIHEPQYGLFGDFQIDLNKVDTNYISLTNNITCTLNRSSIDPCNLECTLPSTDSKIKQFKPLRGDFKEPSNIIVRKNDSSLIDTFERFQDRTLGLKIQLGSSGVSDLKQMQGKCDISHSYGFTSNEETYLVLRVQNINTTGLIPFHSNCTFDRNSIKCEYDEPTKLVLKNNQSGCLIRLPTVNKTLIVNVTYFNIQVRAKKQLRCTEKFSGYGEAFLHLVTGTRFIRAVIGTIFLFHISALLANFVLQFHHKRHKQLYSVEKQDDLVDL